jgi:hypothetical protein
MRRYTDARGKLGPSQKNGQLILLNVQPKGRRHVKTIQ